MKIDESIATERENRDGSFLLTEQAISVGILYASIVSTKPYMVRYSPTIDAHSSTACSMNKPHHVQILAFSHHI